MYRLMNKSLETLLYVASKAPQPTIFHVGHLVYLANKLHLEKYGREITGERFARMKDGPVPSAIYDWFKDVNLGRTSSRNYETARKAITKPSDGQTVIPRRQPDMEAFSESDTECLDESIRRFGGLSFPQLKNITHDPAYDKAKETSSHFLRLDDIIDLLENGKDLKAHLRS